MTDRGLSCRELIEIADNGQLDLEIAVDALRERGFDCILTEGGPRLMGSMLGASAVDELFHLPETDRRWP